MTRLGLALVIVLTLSMPVLAQATKIATSGTLPTHCTVGNIYLKTGSAAGLYTCLATDTWTAIEGVGTSSDTQVLVNDGGVVGGNAGFTFSDTLQDLAVSGLTIIGNSPCAAIQFSPTGTHCDDANDLRISYTNVGVQFFNELSASSILTFHDKFDEIDIGSNTTEVDFNGAPLAFYSPITGGDLHLLTFSDPITTPTHTPSSATDTGVAGQFAWDSNFIYICVATNAWKRVAIAAW